MNKAQRPRTPPKINLQSGRVSDLPPIMRTVAGVRTANPGESEHCKEVTDNVLTAGQREKQNDKAVYQKDLKHSNFPVNLK